MIRPQPPTGAGSRPLARNPCAQAIIETLLARLTKLVTERFERISGLTVLVVPIDLPGAAEDDTKPSQPGHPACVEFAGTAYCQESWRAHVAKLKYQPEVNWHHCDYGKLCAVVPFVWKRRCLVACKLVCPDSMKADAFEMHVELLDVLIENFVLKESELLAHLAHSSGSQGDVEPSPGDEVEPADRGRPDHPQVRAALNYIKKHLTDSSMTVARIARDLDVNATYLAHLFSLQVGVRMSRYIARRRIELAKTLLASTRWQIKRVAYETGHGNPFWFSEVFREHTGVTPSKFRQDSQSS